MIARLVGVLLIACAAAAQPVFAERADRDKPTQIDADSWRGEELKQVVVYSGRVVLTKGTLRITGERLELREDPEGYQYAVVTAAPGALATFRQRRDPKQPGVEEIVEAAAERLEYDGKAETVRLNGRAQVKRLENGEQRDEFSGAVITYDMRESRYSGTGGEAQNGGRTRTIIAPRASATPSAPAAPLAPARGIDPERKQ
jgi:lipopolysaccharide export system protein LptA